MKTPKSDEPQQLNMMYGYYIRDEELYDKYEAQRLINTIQHQIQTNPHARGVVTFRLEYDRRTLLQEISW